MDEAAESGAPRELPKVSDRGPAIADVSREQREAITLTQRRG
jgi:hypothetical protein